MPLSGQFNLFVHNHLLAELEKRDVAAAVVLAADVQTDLVQPVVFGLLLARARVEVGEPDDVGLDAVGDGGHAHDLVPAVDADDAAVPGVAEVEFYVDFGACLFETLACLCNFPAVDVLQAHYRHHCHCDDDDRYYDC